MERLDKLGLWYQVSAAKFLGPVRFKKLWEVLGANLGRVFSMTDEELLGVKGAVTSQNLKGIREQAGRADESRAFMARQVELCQRAGGRILTLDDPDYPVALKESKMCHAIVYCIGEVQKFTQYDRALAIVGTRSPAARSAQVAHEVAEGLAARGWVIVSGLAKGVDSQAHKGALDVNGKTIAVLGCGPDVLYPSDSADLYEQIRASGLILSEFPFGTRPEDWKLKKRNKTTVALSATALIVETGAKGGTMNAAKACKEQGKRPYVLLPTWDCDRSGNVKAVEEGGVPIAPDGDVSAAIEAHLTRGATSEEDVGCLVGQHRQASTVRELDLRRYDSEFKAGESDYAIRAFLLREAPTVYRVLAEKSGKPGRAPRRVYEKGYVVEHLHAFVENEDLVKGWVDEARAAVLTRVRRGAGRGRGKDSGES